jgi:hypothetical protein
MDSPSRRRIVTADVHMKTIPTLLAAALLLAGCTETPKYMGGPVDRDQNVLTGGPITGTTIQNLPRAVKDTLKQRVPHEEINTIDSYRRDGQVIYEFTFVNSDISKLFIREDGEPVVSLEARK